MNSEVIKQMVDDIINNRQADALQKFDSVMGDKITNSLETRKVEIASTLGQDQEEIADETV